MVLALIGVWTILSIFIPEKCISRLSLWASLVVGSGTTITSVLALMISIMSYKKTEMLRIKKIEEDANRFINKNNEDIVYIPLCLIANAYDKHHKFKRDIYNYFNLLNRDVQKEVLKQLNYDNDLILNNQWINKGIKRIRNFISKNDLGKDYLYENGKYFLNSINYADFVYDGACEYEHIMPDVFNWNPKIFFDKGKAFAENITFFDYVDSYLNAKAKDPIKYNLHKNEKPLDILANICNFNNCDSNILSYWLMEVVSSLSSMLLREKELSPDEMFVLSKGDAVLETFEDRFLDVLMDLYNLEWNSRNCK